MPPQTKKQAPEGACFQDWPENRSELVGDAQIEAAGAVDTRATCTVGGVGRRAQAVGQAVGATGIAQLHQAPVVIQDLAVVSIEVGALGQLVVGTDTPLLSVRI